MAKQKIRKTRTFKQMQSDRNRLWERVRKQITHLEAKPTPYEVTVKRVMWMDIGPLDGTDIFVVVRAAVKNGPNQVILLSEDIRGLGSRYNIVKGKKLLLYVTIGDPHPEIYECVHLN